LARLAELNPESRTGAAVAQLEAILEKEFPFHGDHVQSIGHEIARGVSDGWLCNRGPDEARFSRLAKPSAETFDFSVDCVSMTGKAIEHTHPDGEITIGFAAQGADAASLTFDGRPCGWVFMPPGSRHVPHVRGGRMNLIYFLPHGSVQWHPSEGA
jgi:2-hydroxylaminobenzoate mutase